MYAGSHFDFEYQEESKLVNTCLQYAMAMLLKSLDERFSRLSSILLLFIFKAKLARSISVKKKALCEQMNVGLLNA